MVSQESRFAQRAEGASLQRRSGGWEGAGDQGTVAKDYRGQRR